MMYRRGRALEYAVKKHLEEQGYFVVRSAGSKGPADLVALREGEILLIQCKKDGRLSKDEAYELLEAARIAGGKAILAYKEKRTLVLKEVNLPLKTAQGVEK